MTRAVRQWDISSPAIPIIPWLLMARQCHSLWPSCHMVTLAQVILDITAPAKLAGLRPQAGNRGGGLANEVFANPAGLAIICENYIDSYHWDMQLTCRTCNLDSSVGLYQSVPKTIEQALIYRPKPGFIGPNNWHNTTHEKKIGHRDCLPWAHSDQNGHSQPWLSHDWAVT